MGNCRSDNHSDHQQVATQRVRSRFNPFYQVNKQNEQQQRLLNQYHFHSNYDDKFLGRCSILQHKQTKNFYLSKQIQTHSQQQYQNKLQQFLLIQSKLNLQNIIQIKHIIQKQTDGFFSLKQKIILVVDYPLTNLQKQFNNRLISKLDFSREEIINILISCIKGYSLIQRQKQNTDKDIFKNDKIRLKNIFFGIKNKDSLIKVAESSLLAEKSNLEYILKGKYGAPQNRDIYLSPEQFNAYLKGKKDQFFQKAGVFSFGMSLLDICLMDSSKQIYQFDDDKMNFNQIRNRILIAGKKYGPIVQRFLSDMLQIDDKKRPSFNELQSKIPSLLVSRTINEGSRMNLSIARSNSYYLKNNPKIIKQNSRNSRNSKDGSVRSRRSTSRKGSLNKSQTSSVSMTSRYSNKFGHRLRVQRQQPEQLDKVHQIYDRHTGREYIGQKKGALKHGQGRYQFSKDGGHYEGQWKNNKMDGKGESFFRQGQLQYSGEWKADEYHGWGILYSNPESHVNWVSYEGEFKNGVKEGRGQMVFQNGVIYDGEFRGDKIHGRGKIISRKKIIKDGLWEISNPDTFLKEQKIQF